MKFLSSMVSLGDYRAICLLGRSVVWQDRNRETVVHKYFTNLWNITSYKIRCYIYEILKIYSKAQICELILPLQNVGQEYHEIIQLNKQVI